MNRIYEKLKHDENFKDKLNFDQSRNCLTIVFNEYLSLEYLEGNYKGARDEGVIFFRSAKSALMHFHITEDEEALEIITDFAKGTDVYLENTSIFAYSKLRMMKKEEFEKKKERYMSKKSLRIYTADLIIKRNIK